LSQFPVIATGIVNAPEAAIRQGPGSGYSTVSRIQPGDVFGILGKNGGGDWIYVIDASLSPGWLPLNQLRVLGSLEKVPVLPPDPVAYFAQQAGITMPAAGANAGSPVANAPAGETSGGSPTASQPASTANLKPVTTATVNSAALNMRSGPGNTFDKLATLTRQEQVGLLALNPVKDWALVQRADQQQGWVYLNFLTVAGSIANVPVVLVNALNSAAPAGQAVLVAGPAEAAPAGEPTAFTDLGPVMVAQIARPVVPVRPGPSTNEAAIGELRLSDEKIDVLATDHSGQWLLVRPVSTKTGWVALNDLTVGGAPLAPQQLATAPKVYTAWVTSNAVETRNGPGIYHKASGTLAINTLVSILGLDETQSWVLVKPIPGGSAAWAPINFLKISGRWADLPPAPALPQPEPVAQASQAAPPFTPARPLSQSVMVIQRSSGGDIMFIKPDGSGLRRLTTGIDPVLSPDGQTVAFTRWQGETGSVWLINIDGTQERSVLENVKQAKGPDWSPDGSQLVMNFQQGGRLDFEQKCAKLSKGSNPRPPRNARDFEVKLNDDFEPELCYTIPPDEHWTLKVLNLADNSFNDVDGGTYAFRPAWDPSQSWRIVSDSGRGLVELDVNRNYRQTITDEIGDSSPVFSPDGRFIVVSLGREGGGQGYDLFHLNTNGTGRVRLTETPLWESAAPTGGKLWNNVAPAWSPDATQIAFVTDRTGRWEIWVMQADGSNPHPMFSDEINNQLQLTYNFVDERMLSWR
jgi:TolB protein